jgi:hypothetical protein
MNYRVSRANGEVPEVPVILEAHKQEIARFRFARDSGKEWLSLQC